MPKPRIRPTMADWRAARDLEWLEDNPDLVQDLGENMYAVFDHPVASTSRCHVKGLRRAIELARKLQAEKEQASGSAA